MCGCWPVTLLECHTRGDPELTRKRLTSQSYIGTNSYSKVGSLGKTRSLEGWWGMGFIIGDLQSARRNRNSFKCKNQSSFGEWLEGRRYQGYGGNTEEVWTPATQLNELPSTNTLNDWCQLTSAERPWRALTCPVQGPTAWIHGRMRPAEGVRIPLANG